MRVDWNNLTVKLYNCTFSAWRHGIRTRGDWPRVMRDNDLWLFGRGRGVMTAATGKIELRPNRILWLRPGYSYNVMQDPDDPIAHYYLHFDLIRPDGSKFYPTLEEMPEVLECFNHSYWFAMAGNIRQILNFACVPRFQIGKATEIAAVVEPMVRDMLAGIELCDSLTRRPEKTGRLDMVPIRAADFFAENPGKFHPIAEVAARFSLSRSRFTKVFTDFWHVSPQQYQIIHRIEQAKHLLTETLSPVGEIASRLGYADPYFFSRQFKKVTGVSPNDYRLSARKKTAGPPAPDGKTKKCPKGGK